VHLAIDVAPFLALAKPANQLLKDVTMFRRIFKPRQKIKRFGELAAVMQAPGHSRQILETDRRVARAFLENDPTFILSKSPPRGVLSNGNERGARCLGPSKLLLTSLQLIRFCTGRVAKVARDSTQNPLRSLRYCRRPIGRL